MAISRNRVAVRAKMRVGFGFVHPASVVKVTTTSGDTWTGRVVSADEDRATLDADDAVREISYADVAKARVEIEFNRQKNAGRRGSAASSAEKG